MVRGRTPSTSMPSAPSLSVRLQALGCAPEHENLTAWYWGLCRGLSRLQLPTALGRAIH
jgi:hypothetical protein